MDLDNDFWYMTPKVQAKKEEEQVNGTMKVH